MADQGHKETDELLEEIEKKLQKEYEQAVRETQEKLDDYLRKFQIKDEIKRRQLREGSITKAEYNYWKTGQIMIGQRWEEMRKTLAQDYHNTNVIARSIVNGYMPEVYALNHNYATFEVEKGSKLDTSYTLYDRQTAERLIRENPEVLPPPGANMKARIAANKDIAWQEGQIQSATLQAILQGESIPNMAKRICTQLGNTDYASAVRYARTSTTGAENAGRVDAYKRAQDMGIPVEQTWVATLDNRTRHSHRELDGETIGVDTGEIFSNGCRYPGDPNGPPEEVWNCRCTTIAQIKGFETDITDMNLRHNSHLGDMSYDEWKHKHDKKYEVSIPGVQGQVGRARTVDEINDIMNSQGWFRTNRAGITSEADLTGCDLESAKSIASSYQQVFEKYPQLAGKIDAPNAQPVGMKNNTYAWCYIRNNGMVQVNPNKYNNWDALVQSYEKDVVSNWHPAGTTAESIVTHEIGHAIDGLLAREGILGGITSSGEYRMASSSLKTTIMNRAAKKDPDLADLMMMDKQWKGSQAVSEYVSRYATETSREWFAECFAEYITSANPRIVASEFGAELEKLMEKLS